MDPSEIVSGVSRERDPGSLSSLFQQMRTAEGRLDALRARVSKPADHDALATIQELDAAHEELRMAEEHLHGQADAIAQLRSTLDIERSRYRELFDVAPDPYLLTDMRGNILEANQRACALLNIDAVFLSRKPLAIFVGAEDRGPFRAVLDLLARDERVSNFEVRLRPRSSLMPAWTAVTVCHALGPDGAPSALRWVLRDITVGKEAQPSVTGHARMLEQKLRERTQELEAAKHLLEHSLAREKQARAHASLAESEFETLLAAVAHELRSPLSSIAGWVQLIGLGRLEADVRDRAIASMTRSVRTLTRMVEDLVDHARSKGGFFRLERTRLQLPLLLSEALEACRPAAAQKGITLVSQVPDEVPAISADPQRLQQVLSNLLGNALKFTPEGGEVYLSLECFARHVEIAITDTGSGIDPAFLPRVFDAFTQQSRASTVACPVGLGLGLHLARWFVELHGGSIRAESAGRGSGARFVVKLPVESGPISTAPPSPHH
jgi:PAS domain S-box-containing protein